jgi:hypothetical protein
MPKSLVITALASGIPAGTETPVSGVAAATPPRSIDFQLWNSSANSLSPVARPVSVLTAPAIWVAVAVSLAIAGLVVSARAAAAARPSLRNMRPVFPSFSQPRWAYRGSFVADRTSVRTFL